MALVIHILYIMKYFSFSTPIPILNAVSSVWYFRYNVLHTNPKHSVFLWFGAFDLNWFFFEIIFVQVIRVLPCFDCCQRNRVCSNKSVCGFDDMISPEDELRRTNADSVDTSERIVYIIFGHKFIFGSHSVRNT